MNANSVISGCGVRVYKLLNGNIYYKMASIIQGKGNGTAAEGSPDTFPVLQTAFAQLSEATPGDRSSVPPRTSIANSSDSTPDAGVVNLSFLPNEILSLIFSYVFQSNGSIEMYGTLREVCPQSRRFQDIIDNLIFLP